MDKIRSLINTHQQRSTDSIEDEPILLDEKNISTKVHFQDFFSRCVHFYSFHDSGADVAIVLRRRLLTLSTTANFLELSYGT